MHRHANVLGGIGPNLQRFPGKRNLGIGAINVMLQL